MTGRFIALEGIDGAGKTTQVRAVREWLEARSIETITTREPGGTPLGEDIRSVLMTDYQTAMPAASELSLIYAARAAHLAERIQPALARGAWVICDRFNDASYAYQGTGRDLGSDAVDALDQVVVGDQQPDLVLLLDLAPDAGLSRLAARHEQNRFDRQHADFHERVRQAYLARAEARPARYRVINAADDTAAVTASVIDAVAEWTGQND